MFTAPLEPSALAFHMTLASSINSILTYRTNRKARIRSRALAITHKVLVLLSVVYVLVLNLKYEQQYIKYMPASTFVEFGLHAPEISEYPESPATLSYCSQLPVGIAAKCVYADEHDLVPATVEGSVFVSTYISSKRFEREACGAEDVHSCKWLRKELTGAARLAENVVPIAVEHFRVSLRHAIRSDPEESDVDRSGHKEYAVRDMVGKLLDQNGTVVDPCVDYPQGECPSYINFGSVGKVDIFPLATLLRAAGIDLDAKVEMEDGSYSTHRFAGLVLKLEIDYSNIAGLWISGNIGYTARVRMLNNRGLRYSETLVSVSHPDLKVVEHRHGIRVEVVQSHKIGKISKLRLILIVVQLLGLTSVCTKIVDIIMVR